MAISIIEAIKELDKITSFEQLRSLIAQLDVQSTGTKTILYSNGFEDNANDIALTLAESNPDIRIIDYTEAARFLEFNNNDALELVLTKLGGNPRNDGLEGRSLSESNQFLFCAIYNGQPGAWATVFKNFVAAAASDNLRIIPPFVDPECADSPTKIYMH